MPKIFQANGFSVHIRTRDHHPSHVHVFKGGGQAKIVLGSEGNLPSLDRAWGMSDRELVKAMNLVLTHQDRLLAEWRRIYGE
jgi:hypothetical protein